MNLQLGARYDFKNEVFEAHQQLTIEQGVNDFRGKGKKFGKILRSVHKDLKKQISNVGDKLIAAYYKKQLEQIDVNFTVSGFNEDMHTNRKLIKILIYNYKLASKPLSNELQIDIGYLDELQEALGQWHDNVVAAELFSSPELNNKVIVKQINKINGSVKRKIKQLSKDFLIKAKVKPQGTPTNAEVDKPAGTHFRQGYLLDDAKRTIRIRATDDKAFITIKGTTTGISRKEFEYPIPLDDATAMLDAFAESEVDKVRYCIKFDGNLWEVDVFEGKNSGLIMAEIELDDENQTESRQGLYRPEFEHDSCGTGFITNINGHKSNQIIDDALTMLENMEHRGACGCDPETGDGAGILIQLPHEFLMEECSNLEISLPEPGEYGVGNAIEKLGLNSLGYRKLSVNSSVVGETARMAEPDAEQLFIQRPHHITNVDDFERKLYILRRYINKTVTETVPAAAEHFYFTSLSCKTIVYKGQVTTYQLRQYFSDLADPRIASGFAMIHSRFSTNTFPSWKLAQPFRLIAHNGEINTLTGNLNWFYSGLKSYASSYFTQDEMEILDLKTLQKNYVKSINDGLLKIFSKMGISTLQSYHGSQVFEILGINQAVVDKYFTGAVTRIGGLGLDEIARESLCKHKIGFGGSKTGAHLLPEGGIYQWKRRGESHLFNPTTVHLLQHATRSNDYSDFRNLTGNFPKKHQLQNA
eukprot:gene10228-10297_t